MSSDSEQSPSAAGPSLSRRHRLAVVVAASLGIYAVFGYLVVPYVVSSQLVAQIETRTGRKAKLERVAFDPFRVRLEIEGFALPDGAPSTPAVVAFDALRADVHVPSLLIGNLALEEIALEGPRIRAVVDETGVLNLTRILLPEEPEEPEAAPPEEPAEDDASEGLAVDIAIDIDSIRIEGGDVVFVDRSQSPPFEAAVRPLEFALEGFTTRAGGSSPYSLALQIGDRTRLDWTGTVGLDPIRSEGAITLSDFDLRLPWDFLSDRLRFEVIRGALEIEGRYTVDFDERLAFEVEESRAALTGLSLRDGAAAADTDSAFLEVPSLTITGIALAGDDAGLARLSIGEVALDGAEIDVDRSEDGSIQLASLFEVASPAEVEPDGPSDAEKRPAEKRPAEEAPSGLASASGESASTPEIRVDRVAVRDLTIDFEDASTSRPVAFRVDPLALTIEGYSSRPGTAVDVAFEAGVGEGGRLALRGPVTLEPLETHMSIEVERLALGPLEPYLDEVARLDLPTSALGATFDVDFDSRSATSSAVGAPPRIAAKGRVQIDDLLAIDRQRERPFVEWSSLRVEGIDYVSGGAAVESGRSAADRVRVEEIALAGAAAHVVLGRDGRTNLEAIFGGDGDASTPATKATKATEATRTTEDAEAPEAVSAESSGPGPRIEIGRVLLQGIAADFDDLTQDPPFAIRLDDLRGEVSGLSSSERSRAKVALEGRVDDVAPVRIAGQINPLSGDAYTDLAIDVTGVSMPAFTPYAGRFVGYRIERGKLGLDLDYKLNANHLEANNVIELKQFEFGERVESDEATGLPVALALAVLRDPSGDIKIPLPIEGDLDDPSFSVMQLLGQTFINLITRVATSPFGAIAGIVGGSGEDLARVAFEAGSARLADSERGELEEVAGLLAERPALRLEIRGRADPEVDLPGFRRERVMRDVKRAAFEDLSPSEKERIGGPDALELDAEARYEGLAALYRERTGERLRSRVPEASLPPAGPERDAALAEAGLVALAAGVEIDAAEWRTLARARAAAVQGAVLATGQIPAERVFLVDVEVGPLGADGQVPTELALAAE